MSRARRSASQGVSPLLVLGIVLLVAVLGLAGWGTWLYWGSSFAAQDAAAEAVAELEQRWADEEPPADPETPTLVADPEPGRAQWLLRIPALGESWQWPVSVGIDDESLGHGVGWYPGTSQPGQVGNFAVAGQCITGAQPFRDLRRLQVGDEVLVEGVHQVFTYTINSAPADLTVDEGEAWVLDPVPGRDDLDPTQALITLTTCEDLYPTPDRSVGFGVLTSTETK